MANYSLNDMLIAMQARKDRHDPNLPESQRASQFNQDWDHYAVGNEMAGPQFPLWQRLGAVVPAVGHEIARPLLSKSKTAVDIANKLFDPSGNEPPWIYSGAGAGGAATEKAPGFSGAFRNLEMLARGALESRNPSQLMQNSQPALRPPVDLENKAMAGGGTNNLEALLQKLFGR